jgi:hypothetical protein
MKQAHLHTIVVEGRDGFPLDMLRSEGCFPATSDAVGAMTLRADRWYVARQVELTRIAPKDWTPTVARWRSMGWTLVSHRMQPTAW